MSGEMIAIVAVGVALAGCGKTWRGWARGWKRGSTVWNPAWMGASRRWNLGLMGWNVSLANCASAWRTWKGCWKDYARPSPGGSRPARAERGMNLRRYFSTLLVVLPLSSPLSAQETDEDDKFFLGFAGSAVFPYDPNPLAGLGLARLMALCSKLEIPV